MPSNFRGSPQLADHTLPTEKAVTPSQSLIMRDLNRHIRRHKPSYNPVTCLGIFMWWRRVSSRFRHRPSESQWKTSLPGQIKRPLFRAFLRLPLRAIHLQRTGLTKSCHTSVDLSTGRFFPAGRSIAGCGTAALGRMAFAYRLIRSDAGESGDVRETGTNRRNALTPATHPKTPIPQARPFGFLMAPAQKRPEPRRWK